MGDPYGSSGPPGYSSVPPGYDPDDNSHPHSSPAGPQMRLLGNMDDQLYTTYAPRILNAFSVCVLIYWLGRVHLIALTILTIPTESFRQRRARLVLRGVLPQLRITLHNLLLQGITHRVEHRLPPSITMLRQFRRLPREEVLVDMSHTLLLLCRAMEVVRGPRLPMVEMRGLGHLRPEVG